MTETTIEQKEKIMENLAHDLKTPVFSQINALNILLKDKSFDFSDIQRELLSDILSSNIYMRDMILNMLTGFRVKKTKLKTEINNIENTVKDTIKSIEHTLFETGHKLVIKNHCKSPYAEYDEIGIKRVLINLLSNAAKHSKPYSEIILEIYNTNGNILINIINSGAIIYKNPQDVFKPYITNCKDTSKCSNGLGLYISKQIIEAHFGKITAQNLENNLVKFSFEIPIINTNQ